MRFLLYIFLLLAFFPSLAQAELRIVYPGSMDAVPAWLDDAEEWYAIMPSGEVKRTTLSYEAQADEIHPYRIKGEEGAFFYVSGIPLKDGAFVTTYELPHNNSPLLEPGGGNHVRTPIGELHFFATGKYSLNTETNWPFLSDYKVYMRWGDALTVVTEPGSVDDGFTEILWVGDLNGDGVPDPILNVASKYSYIEYVLFLSQEKEGGVDFIRSEAWTVFGC